MRTSESVGIPVKRWDLEHEVVYIIPMGDFHVGTTGFAYDKFAGYRDWILARRNAYVVLLGDLIEATVRHSKGDIWEQDISPGRQIDQVTALLKPLKNRILGMVMGNHERRIYDQTGFEPMSILCHKLGLPEGVYGRDALRLDLYIPFSGRKRPFYVFLTHGWGGARKTGGQLNKLEDLGDVIHADVYIVGHEHKLIQGRDDYLMPVSGGKWSIHRKNYVQSGCFADYASLGGYLVRIGRKPPDIGAPRIRLQFKHARAKDVHVSI